jgi:hypothetical protein
MGSFETIKETSTPRMIRILLNRIDMSRIATLLLAFMVLPVSAPGQQIVVEAEKDNTLYEASDGSLSNGAGARLFVGKTANGAIRRALIRFDVASVAPEGAEVESATLEMNVSKTIADEAKMSIHRVRADWGEGGSDAAGDEGRGTDPQENDATWVHRFFNTATWQTPGGDFDLDASESVQVEGVGAYTWEASEQMVADIQSWIDTPEENFGWILIGDEDANRTAKRFDSREIGTAENRPRLRITFRTATDTESEAVPAVAELLPAWPNPFSDVTRIAFELEREAVVSLDVFDIAGRRVASLAQGRHRPGRHEAQFRADTMPAGLYVYRLSSTSAGDDTRRVQTGTLVLAR